MINSLNHNFEHKNNFIRRVFQSTIHPYFDTVIRFISNKSRMLGELNHVHPLDGRHVQPD